MARPHFFEPLLARQAREHRLVNRSRSLLLATVIVPAFDSTARRTGLLGRLSLPFDTVLAIAPSGAIHTFGMRFPIDVLFVNRDGVVLKRVLSLNARRIAIALGAFAVLEFGAGHPGVRHTEIGDALALDPAAAPPPQRPD